MKRLFVLSLFLFSVSLFAQSTIDFETVGQDFVWTIFANGSGDSTNYAVVANPSASGINTSSMVAKYIVATNADPWSGIFTTSFGSFTLTAANCKPTIMVYKDVISPFNFKLEPPNVDHNVPNTVTNQWEKLTFDYTANIGTTVNVLTIIPDFPAARTAGSTNYFDNIQFVEVIPVELTSFTASVVGNSVQLQWSTATETNNRGFEITRGINNREFTTIGFVKGNGTTVEKHDYSFVDNSEFSGTVYYRLKNMDFDGQHDYSNVVEVTKVVTSYALAQNYPNPFNPTTAITYSIPQNSFVTLKVYNVLGSEVAELVNGEVQAGVHKVNFNGFDLNSGVYFYTIKAGNFSETKKLMLMK